MRDDECEVKHPDFYFDFCSHGEWRMEGGNWVRNVVGMRREESSGYYTVIKRPKVRNEARGDNK